MKIFRTAISVLMVMFLLLGMLPMQVAAEETKDEYMTMQDAAEYLRKELAEFRSGISVKFFFDDPDYYTDTEIMELFLAEVLQYTGVPDEGDYMRWSFQQWGYNIETTFNGVTHYVDVISFSATYNNTAEQERELEQKLDQVFSTLDLDGKSDYEKIKTIYEYVCENVAYAEEIASGESGPMILPETQRVYASAYGALVLGSTTCQGFSSLLYRMMLKAGIDCRLIAGGNHGWNIVKLDGKYYYLEPTWDSDNFRFFGKLEYVLDGSATFRTGGSVDSNNSVSEYDHIAWIEHFTAEFLDQYPISVLDYGEVDLLTGDAGVVLGSGWCGNNARWTLTGDGKLTVSGTGAIWNAPNGTFWNGKDERWAGLNGYITQVEICEGITAIGDRAFMNCPRLTQVSIADSVKSIGAYAFGLCENLTGISLPDTVKTLGSSAFYQCARLENATLSAGIEVIPENAFAGCTALKTVRIPNGIRKIGSAAFACCTSLQGVEIPASVTSLGDSAFAQAFDPEEKVTLTVPSTVTEIQGACFEDSGLYGVKLNASIDRLDTYMFHQSHALRWVEFPDTIQAFGQRTFWGCANLQDVKLPANLNDLGAAAFVDCKALQTVELPATLEAIPADSFMWCDSLEKIVIPEAVTEIGNSAFYVCESLKIVTIPAGVRKVGNFAFTDCKALIAIFFEGDAPEFGEEDILNVWETTTVYYPADNSTWTAEVLEKISRDGFHHVIAAHGANEPHTIAWYLDDVSHWKQCTGCVYREESTDHSFDSDCTCIDCGYVCHNYQWQWADVDHWQLCADCGAVTETSVHCLDGEKCIDCGYVWHSFLWQRNEESHWKQCEICGTIENETSHRFDGAYTCMDCGYVCVEHSFYWQWTEADHWEQCGYCGYANMSESHRFESGHSCDDCGYVPNQDNKVQQQQGSDDYLWVAGVLGAGILIGGAVLLKKKKVQ